jgi:hypothetical protein
VPRKKDDGGPGAMLEAIHATLCKGTGLLAIMLEKKKLSPSMIAEIGADVRAAGSQLSELEDQIAEMQRQAQINKEYAADRKREVIEQAITKIKKDEAAEDAKHDQGT